MINLIKRIIPILGLKNIASEETIKKGLEKISPKFKSFFSESANYGYPIGAALGFLQSEFSQAEKKPISGQRPDEGATLETERQNKLPNRLGKTLGNIAGGAALGGLGGAALGGLASSIPSQEEQPAQGIPEEPQQDQPPVYDGLAGLKQFPLLVKFIQKESAKGQGITTIVGKARQSRALGKMVNQIEETSGEPFEALLTRLIGGSSKSGKQSTQGGEAKTGFLQGLQQLGSLLQGLKGG